MTRLKHSRRGGNIIKDKLRAELLGNLGFKEGIDVVEVAPKNQHFYNLAFDTSKLLPGKAAKIIHHGTYRRY
jgi:hypothetical protein